MSRLERERVYQTGASPAVSLSTPPSSVVFSYIAHVVTFISPLCSHYPIADPHFVCRLTCLRNLTLALHYGSSE